MAQRTELISALAFSLIDELILDMATEEHLVALRRRSPCELCGGNCNAGVCPPSTSYAPIASGSGGRATSPGPNSAKQDVAYYDCPVCKRSVGSNRYAQHLSNCMGFSGRGRTAKRAAAISSTNGYSSSAHNGAHKSPYVTSDEDDDAYIVKKKAEPQRNGTKRAASPLPSQRPAKKLNSGSSLAPSPAPMPVKAPPISRPSPFAPTAKGSGAPPSLKAPPNTNGSTLKLTSGSKLAAGSSSSSEGSDDGSSNSDSPARPLPFKTTMKPLGRPQVIINANAHSSIARKAPVPSVVQIDDSDSSGDA